MKAELVDYMGDDLSVVNAARVSFAKVKDEFEEKDVKLINYLAKHDHWTPFGHTAITLRMQAPIPIRTQCFKHKVGLVENEESRRYIDTRPKLYIPDEFRERPDGSIKQGSGSAHPDSEEIVKLYRTACNNMIDLYEETLQWGVAPEQARFFLPQGVEVNWVWTGNLVSFANFYLKRTDSTAQGEIRELAEEVSSVIRPLFPVSWDALVSR